MAAARDRPAPWDCSDCPVSGQILTTLDKMDKKMDRLTEAVALQDSALQVHIARHLERERVAAGSIHWPKIVESLLTWITIGLVATIIVLILTHSQSAIKIFGG